MKIRAQISALMSKLAACGGVDASGNIHEALFSKHLACCSQGENVSIRAGGIPVYSQKLTVLWLKVGTSLAVFQDRKLQTASPLSGVIPYCDRKGLPSLNHGTLTVHRLAFILALC